MNLKQSRTDIITTIEEIKKLVNERHGKDAQLKCVSIDYKIYSLENSNIENIEKENITLTF